MNMETQGDSSKVHWTEDSTSNQRSKRKSKEEVMSRACKGKNLIVELYQGSLLREGLSYGPVETQKTTKLTYEELREKGKPKHMNLELQTNSPNWKWKVRSNDRPQAGKQMKKKELCKDRNGGIYFVELASEDEEEEEKKRR
ncbi:hypothetical protein PIB30_067206 [Stylosanthes scabra]|uniref:Uncharacterized protein n=1 Tax=Stylosanthes scabra TaxID=79078 RepID=A0ABU6VMQ0_9FABA|nr:hypothetical protein [Stylosanthes scabra]